MASDSSSHAHPHRLFKPHGTRPPALRPHTEDMALATSFIPNTRHIRDEEDFGEGRLPRILSGQERSDGHAAMKDHKIAISSTSKQAGQTVAPFLAKHIPEQYNPFSRPADSLRSPTLGPSSTNTKYCYRHRPDLKCRRQANEPSMEQLQNVPSSKPTISLTLTANNWDRNWAHYHSQTSRALRMSGLYFLRHRQNIGT